MCSFCECKEKARQIFYDHDGVKIPSDVIYSNCLKEKFAPKNETQMFFENLPRWIANVIRAIWG